jgi:oligoribonuclease (3'-5' exoribonuclease)
MNKLNIEVSVTVDFVETMHEVQRQHGTTGLIEGIIEYCCDNMNFTFEQELIAALQKYIKENS